jgi:hypothetical protein
LGADEDAEPKWMLVDEVGANPALRRQWGDRPLRVGRRLLQEPIGQFAGVVLALRGTARGARREGFGGGKRRLVGDLLQLGSLAGEVGIVERGAGRRQDDRQAQAENGEHVAGTVVSEAAHGLAPRK